MDFLFYTLLTNAASLISRLKFGEISKSTQTPPAVAHQMLCVRTASSGIGTLSQQAKNHEVSLRSPFLLTCDVSLLLQSLPAPLISQGASIIVFLSLLVRWRL